MSVIAIDGTFASGKGTLGKGLAAHYGLPYLDTGKLYRATHATARDARDARARRDAPDRDRRRVERRRRAAVPRTTPRGAQPDLPHLHRDGRGACSVASSGRRVSPFLKPRIAARTHASSGPKRFGRGARAARLLRRCVVHRARVEKALRYFVCCVSLARPFATDAYLF